MNVPFVDSGYTRKSGPDETPETVPAKNIEAKRFFYLCRMREISN